MAILFMDGFDKYGPVGVTTPTLTSSMQTGEWTSSLSTNATPTPSIIASLNGLSTGYALLLNLLNLANAPPETGSIARTLATNYARLIGGCRINVPMVGNTAFGGVAFLDGASYQCAIGINLTGNVVLYSNRLGVVASIVATSASSISANTTHYMEWDITFGASASYQVWIDAVSVLSGTGNTRGGTSNNYANVFAITATHSVVAGNTDCIKVDDLYLFDSTGTTNNAVLLTSPLVETRFPTADVQQQFTSGAYEIGGTYASTASTNAPGANQLFLIKVTPSVNCTLSSLSCYPSATSGTVKTKAVIYPDSSNSPNAQTLIATGVEVVGMTASTTFTSSFSSPPSLTSGTSYWIGFITDTSVALTQFDGTSIGVKVANTYTSGAPATCPTVTTGQVTWRISGNVTGVSTNFPSVALNPSGGDLSYVYASTVNNEDLYSFPATTNTATSVYALAVKASARKTDSGARTVDLRIKSGVFDGAGNNAGQSPALTYGYLSSYFETDPATSSAWTGSAINALSAGIKIAS